MYVLFSEFGGKMLLLANRKMYAMSVSMIIKYSSPLCTIYAYASI